MSAELRAAVGADETQQREMQLAMDSEVVLVQGPPGTGKTYVGVQMVKAMLEAERTWPCGTRLQILCLV
jgi:phosphate starvation-inducible protein PhoH